MNITFDVKQGTYSRGIAEYDRLGAREWMEAQWLNMKNNRMAAGDDAATALEKASGKYGRVDDAVKFIDPRKE